LAHAAGLGGSRSHRSQLKTIKFAPTGNYYCARGPTSKSQAVGIPSQTFSSSLSADGNPLAVCKPFDCHSANCLTIDMHDYQIKSKIFQQKKPPIIGRLANQLFIFSQH
jgi:hypothetical protein